MGYRAISSSLSPLPYPLFPVPCNLVTLSLLNHRWPVFPEAGSLLEGIGQLQHPPVVLVAPDDLHADGQALRREATRYRDRRETGDADVIARPHPVDIGLHRHAVDFTDVRLVHIEGRHLAHGQRQKLILLHEAPHAVIEPRTFALGLAKLW